MWLQLEASARLTKDHPILCYQIMVHTSDVRGAGCDGEAHIEMHGTQGSSGKIALGGSGNHFERDTVSSKG